MVHDGAVWCYRIGMGLAAKSVRQSVSLPTPLAKRVKAMARSQKTSANRVIIDLIEAGLISKDDEKRHFFQLAEQLTISNDSDEQTRLKEELAKMTFGE